MRVPTASLTPRSMAPVTAAKGGALFVQQPPDRAHHGIVPQSGAVPEQLPQVAGDGQPDIGIHVDLADAAGDGGPQLVLADAVGVLDIPAQGVDLVHNILGDGGGAVGDQEGADSLVVQALPDGGGDLPAFFRKSTAVRGLV